MTLLKFELSNRQIMAEFDRLIRETFTPEELPIHAEYAAGLVEFEGKVYAHTLMVTFLYWDGYQWQDDVIRFLVK